MASGVTMTASMPRSSARLTLATPYFSSSPAIIAFFFFNDTATTEIYTLSLHDALPIYGDVGGPRRHEHHLEARDRRPREIGRSTRLNSSHSQISYAVFCLKKKKSTRCRLRYEPT